MEGYAIHLDYRYRGRGIGFLPDVDVVAWGNDWDRVLQHDLAAFDGDKLVEFVEHRNSSSRRAQFVSDKCVKITFVCDGKTFKVEIVDNPIRVIVHVEEFYVKLRLNGMRVEGRQDRD